MSKDDWKLWLFPIAAWAFYCCWHFGYQSGYSDGHETAWKMYQPAIPNREVSTVDVVNEPFEPSIATDARR